ncbi:phage tail tube protein [Dactylosporangium sp. NPDC000555]|uniref:phage tail tube protein n=1 Tax=Dactylosporangium sp. NPDC000555 TaxID=3154260 RepID=UPI0033181D78
MVLTATYVSLAAPTPGDISGAIKKAELSIEVDEKDVTNFLSAGWKEVKGGLKSGSLALTFMNDMTAASIDASMWALLGSVVTFEVRASNAAVGTSNPKYTGSVLVKQWNPIAGSPGDVNEASYTYPTSGAVTRATS